MDKKRTFLKPGALTAPIPPAMVTVGDLESSNVLTVAWTGILATVPPKTYISVRPSRHSYGILREKGEFVINLPSSSMAKTVDFVGIYTGAKMDKFEKCALTKIPSEKVSAPTIAECPIALECRVTDVLPMGSHDVFIADIVSVSCKDEILDSDGKMRFEHADLLAYAHGEYYSLGEKLGRFGFSTDKPKKRANSDSKAETEKASATAKSDKKVSASVKSAKKIDGTALTVENKKDTNNAPTHRPFYETAPRSKSQKVRPKDKNKGAPRRKKRGDG